MTFDRIFTLAEAQNLLPQLESQLNRAARAHREVEAIDEEMQSLVSHILLAGGVQVDPIRTTRLRAERTRQAEQLEEALGAITASGAQVKDLDEGLLDFPCLLRGQIVLLCWKRGENAIEHWHGTHEGYANRKPLDPSMYPHDPDQRVQ